MDLPTTMKAWQYSAVRGGIEKQMRINPQASLPKAKRDQHVVKIIAAALNPADYKVAELPFVARLSGSLPATPGMDFVGRIVKPAAGSPLKPGELVFGAAGNSVVAGGALAEYAVAKVGSVAPVPDGVDPLDTVGVGIAGITAYQSIVPFVKNGSRVFINGGSGGTGAFGIQFAKAAGCQVTTSCSSANVELCKDLGADHVINYKNQNVVSALCDTGEKFDHVVDNVNHDADLYWNCHRYTIKAAKFIVVGGEATFQAARNFLAHMFWPSFLGGGKREYRFFMPVHTTEDLEQIVRWIQSGKVRPLVDSRFDFDDAPRAFEKLKTGRARGKIVIQIETA